MKLTTSPATATALLGLALFTTLTLGACSKSKDADPTPAASTAKISWSEGGRSYECSNAAKSLASGLVAFGGSAPTGVGTEVNSVSFLLPAAVGTYTVGSSGTALATLLYTTNASATGVSYSASGGTGSATFTITQVDPKLEGTFTATTVSTTGATKVLTAGRFSF